MGQDRWAKPACEEEKELGKENGLIHWRNGKSVKGIESDNNVIAVLIMKIKEARETIHRYSSSRQMEIFCRSRHIKILDMGVRKKGEKNVNYCIENFCLL